MARTVIRHFMTAEEAQLARAQLEAMNIDASVHGEESSRFIPGAGARQGVTLEVDEADVERATEALAAPPEIDDSVRAAHPELAKETAADVVIPGEAAATRAFRAALIGVFLCPVFLHLYSLWLLRAAFADWHRLPQGSKRAAIAACVVDALALGGVLWTLLNIY